MGRLLSDINPEEYFRLVDGTEIKSIKELADSLKFMDKSVFDHHVTADRNDFSNWVKYVFGADRIAKEMSDAKTPSGMSKKLNRLFYLPKKEGRPAKPKRKAKIYMKSAKRTKPKMPAKKKQDVLSEILQKEREINLREKKIEEIEEKIEHRLKSAADKGFFSSEFIEGILVGALITLIISVIYFKFFL